MIARAGSRLDMEWSKSLEPPIFQNAQLTSYDCQSRIKNGYGMIRMMRAINMLECTTHPLRLPEQDQEWTSDHQHDQSHQHASMTSPPPMIARAGLRMEIGSSESSEPLMCQNAQLTSYNCQRRSKNEHGIISMIRANHMPDCPTHQLWFPEQNEERTWGHQNHQSQQHASMHNSPTMIARAGSRMDMESSAWSDPTTCMNAQLTLYDCQSRMKNRHRIISMIRATNMPECATHLLWLREQDPKWIWDHPYDEGHHHARMHNLPSMITRAGSRMDMGSSGSSEPPTCQNAQLTSYDCQSRIKNGYGIIRMMGATKMPECTTNPLRSSK